jgi:ribosome maturation factor RimP
LSDIAALSALIAPIATQLGFELVRVQLNGSKAAMTLQVMAEDPATGQMTLAQCATLSRAISEMLDVEDPIESEYALEVSSPGIDRPLTRPTDFAKWAGHEVRLKLEPEVDGRKRLHGTITGICVGTDGAQNVSFDMPTIGAVTVPYGAISGAKLVLTNKLINATRPLDAGDADEIIESDESVANDNDLTDED